MFKLNLQNDFQVQFSSNSITSLSHTWSDATAAAPPSYATLMII